jgi:predicted RNase H-like nuclease (RuvC/YqgF family)
MGIANMPPKEYRLERKIYWMQKRIEEQQEEIERLRAQVAALASSAGKDYHNPADVETLKLSVNALKGIIQTYEDDFTAAELDGLCAREDAILNYYARATIAAIDQIGGQEDGKD